MSRKTIRLAFAGMAFAALVPMTAQACGGPFDVLCNTGKAIEKAAHDVGDDFKRNPDHYLVPGFVGVLAVCALTSGAACAGTAAAVAH